MLFIPRELGKNWPVIFASFIIQVIHVQINHYDRRTLPSIIKFLMKVNRGRPLTYLKKIFTDVIYSPLINEGKCSMLRVLFSLGDRYLKWSMYSYVLGLCLPLLMLAMWISCPLKDSCLGVYIGGKTSTLLGQCVAVSRPTLFF